MNKRYRVTLTADERAELVQLLARGKADVRKLRHAQMLMKADESDAGPGWPRRRRGERLCGQLAGVDRPVIENRDQGPGAFSSAVGGAELVEQVDKVGGALGRAGVHEQASASWIEGPEHRPLFCLAGRLDAQIGAAPGPAARQIGMRKHFGFVEEHQINRARSGLGFQVGKALTARLDRCCILAPFERVARAPEDKPI